MNLTIGATTLEIISCTKMRDIKRGFYLDIKIPEDVIGMDALKNLFKDNEETITVTDDEGKVSIYMGFKMLSNMSLEDGFYQLCQVCTSEIEAQLSIAQSKLLEQEHMLSETNALVMAQNQVIIEQATTIDSVLLDVIPAVITETVFAAVEEALGTMSPTEESVEEHK